MNRIMYFYLLVLILINVNESWSNFTLNKTVYNSNDLTNETKIIGGRPIRIQEAPYIASIQLNDQHICGGSIIGRRHILTTANCIIRHSSNWKQLNVHLGSTRAETSGQHIKVSHFFWHDKYNPNKSHIFDIGIMVLKNDIIFNEEVQVVTLPASHQNVPIGTQVKVTGWSGTNLVLQQVDMPILPIKTCQDAYGYEFDYMYMICAGQGGKAPCLEDFGGPLVHDNIQFGISSWPNLCGINNYPSVFTDVSTMRNFIIETVGI